MLYVALFFCFSCLFFLYFKVSKCDTCFGNVNICFLMPIKLIWIEKLNWLIEAPHWHVCVGVSLWVASDGLRKLQSIALPVSPRGWFWHWGRVSWEKHIFVDRIAKYYSTFTFDFTLICSLLTYYWHIFIAYLLESCNNWCHSLNLQSVFKCMNTCFNVSVFSSASHSLRLPCLAYRLVNLLEVITSHNTQYK